MSPFGPRRRLAPWAALSVVAVALLCRSGPLAAEEPAPQGASFGEPPLEATLVFEGRALTTMRAPLLGFSPEERASRGSRRIQEVLTVSIANDVATLEAPEGRIVTLGGKAVFIVLPADLDPLAGEELGEVAEEAASNLRIAVATYREERSFARLVRAIVSVVLATLAAFTLLWLGNRLCRWARSRLPQITTERLGRLRVPGLPQVETERVLRFEHRLIDVVFLVGLLALGYAWLSFVLTRFPGTRPWGQALGGYVLGQLGGLLRGALGAIPSLLTVLLIFLLARLLSRLLRTFFLSVESGAVSVPWLDADVAAPTRRIVGAVIWIFALVAAYPYLPGSSTDAFKGVSVFVGIMVSLGATGIVHQAMSGLIVMYSRGLKVGDYVQIGDHEGIVTSLGMLSTKIRTAKREEVTIPNAVLTSTAMKNLSRLAGNDGVIVSTSVTIGYGAPWRQVHAMLEQAAGRTSGLRRQPAPSVLQRSLSDFYVEYELRAHLDRPETRFSVLSALHTHIQDLFNEHGVQIMSPHYEADPPGPVVVPREQWFADPAKPSET